MAVKVNPDQAAEASRLAKRYDLPADLILRNLRDVQVQAAVDDADTKLATSPKLAGFMRARPFAITQAHDDIDSLSLFETLANSFRRGIPGLKQNASATAMRSNAASLATLNLIEATVASGGRVPEMEDPAGVQYMTPEQRGEYRAAIQRAASGNAQTIASAQAEKANYPAPEVVQQVMQAKSFGEAIRLFMTDPVKFIASVGPESLVQNAPGLAAAAVMPGGTAAKALTMGAGSFSTDYGSSLLEALGAEGVDIADADSLKAAAANPALMRRAAAQAMAHAGVVGAVDGASGGLARRLLLPSKVLAKAPVGRELANIATQTPIQGVLGGVGEAGGAFAAGQELSPGKILAEVVGEAFSAPAEIASVAGGRVRERMAQAQEAKTQAAELAKVMDAAKASKLRGRDAGVFADFAKAATADQEVFIDANTFAQSVTPQMLEALPESIREQLPEALAAGGDLAIKLGDFAAHLADVPELAQHLRVAPEAMSAAEAAAYVPDEHLPDEVGQMMASEPLPGDPHAEAIMQARQQVADALTAAGRFTPQANQQYVDLMGAFISTMADRAGLDAEAIKALAPRIVSQLEAAPAGSVFSQNPEAQPGPDSLGTYNPNTKTIALLKNANLTTLLHEGGHFFLDTMTDLAARGDAPAGVSGDMQALLGWFGVKDLSTWRGMTVDQQRKHHEQFARGFERYLMEGKAPTAELAGMFARFRGWLKALYRKLEALNVELTPEVRGVMSRLLATDAQIAGTSGQLGAAPLFATAQAAGMSAEEFATYQAQGQQAIEDAVAQLQSASLRDMQFISNSKARVVRKANAEAKAKRSAIEAEVAAEIHSLPIYAAWRDLARGHTEDGHTIKLSLPDIKANHADLVGKIPQGLATNDANAMPADMVAEAYGLSSGDQLLKLLGTLDKPAAVIEGRTDQLMLEQHGELVNAAAVERAAHEAIANDARARVLTTEANALARAVGAPLMVSREARAFAEAAVAKRKVRELRPGIFSAAEVRAGREAANAFRKGDLASAANAKRAQTLQNVLGKTTTAALAEVKNAIAYLSSFDNAATRKAIGPEYADQVDQLLERVDLRASQSLTDIDRRKSLAAWVTSQEELGFAPVIDDRLLAQAQRQSYKDMTLEELRGLVDTVKNIEHLGRLKERLLTARDKRSFAETVEALSTSIEQHGGERRPVALEGEKGVKPWLQGMAAAHRKISSLMHQMDGGKDAGPLWSALVRPMNEAGTREEVMIEKATQRLAEIYKPIMALKGGTTGAKLFIPEIGDSLTRAGRLSVALNLGNDGNRQRLLDGDRWTAHQVQAIIKTLTPVELQFVNQVHEYVDSFWPEIQAQQLRVSGVTEDKVAATPWTATASDGTQVAMRGGYYPAKYDTARSAKAEAHDAAQVAKDMMAGAYVRATTRRGFTKARAEEVVGRPLRKDLGVITQHITEVTHNLAWQEWLVDANRLLSSKAIDGAIRSFYGPAVIRTLKDDLQGIATADVVSGTAIDQALLHLRANVSRATMGLSFTTALMQPFGLTQSMARIGVRPVLRGMARWGGDAARLESSMSWINEKSDFMRLRAKTFNRELTEISGRVGGKSQTAQIIDAGLFYMTTKCQQIADVPTWIGRYEQALAQGLDEGAAVAQADQAVISSQGSGQIKDLAEVQRKHPMLTQFYSYFSVTVNLVTEKTSATDFKNPRAVAGWLADMALLTVIPAIAPAALTGLLRGEDADDPEKWLKKLAGWQASYLLGMVVGVRELSGLVGGFPYNGPPVGRIVTDLGKATQQINQGEVDEPAVLAIVRLLGSAFGIPAVQAIRSYRGWEAWANGDAPVTAVLMGPPPKE
ncbi:MAG: hypothetical protein IV107_03875 [Paucibacter sp.]|nr:hypothetical protein [Roseateles sp.]